MADVLGIIFMTWLLGTVGAAMGALVLADLPMRDAAAVAFLWPIAIPLAAWIRVRSILRELN